MLTPEEERAERALNRQERDRIRTDDIAELDKNREERAFAQASAERQSRRTVIVGVIAGAMGLVGGLGKDTIAAFTSKEAKSSFTIQVSPTPFDDKSLNGLVRVDTRTGTTWVSRTNQKGELEWLQVRDSENRLAAGGQPPAPEVAASK